MNQATKPFFNRLAVVFDFDETLAPDTFAILLQDLGLDVDIFKHERIQPLIDDGWDKYIARAYCLVEESKQRNGKDKITKERLIKVGKELKPFNGVPEMFEHLENYARNVISDVEVEFYLITGGFLEMALNTSIASNFKAMWGCRFHYAADGEIKFIKQQMTNTEKTSYLYYLSKGIDLDKEKDLMFAYISIPDEQLHIPLNQVIYVGDGASDAPCFAVLNKNHGISIGLYKQNDSQEWSEQKKIDINQRVANVAAPDYTQNSELMQSLTLAVESICKKIALSRLSVK
ncbi:MAG: haloacid dehalogenase-like hydrolase [Cyanobacteria bacterium P01_A01_bin.84]